jgi:hypothetical protein
MTVVREPPLPFVIGPSVAARSGFAVRKMPSKQAFYDRERLLPKAHTFE